MMPYSDRLRDVADWFRQLWAESLGKRATRGGEEVFVGPTPVKALGATDQHSQVQLYVEGPFDKTITFLAERDPGADVQIPAAYAEHAELAYLGGHSLGELLRTEMRATEAALAERGRMNMMLEVPAVDARSLGGLFMLLQIATVYAGHFYGVDPLDQPGVELGKELTYGIMGRPRASTSAARRGSGGRSRTPSAGSPAERPSPGPAQGGWASTTRADAPPLSHSGGRTPRGARVSGGVKPLCRSGSTSAPGITRRRAGVCHSARGPAQAIVTRRAETRRQYRGAPFAQRRCIAATRIERGGRAADMRPKPGVDPPTPVREQNSRTGTHFSASGYLNPGVSSIHRNRSTEARGERWNGSRSWD
jgi:hypothetical protein